MKSRYIYLIMFVAILYFLSQFTGYSTLVLPLSKYKYLTDDQKLKIGQVLNPFNDFDFDTDQWTVYVAISPIDFEDLNPIITKTTCLKTNDIDLLKEIGKEWNFRYTGSDTATVNSTIYFIKNEKLIFESGIVIDKNKEGMQNEQYGWIEPLEKKTISKIISKFNRVYIPIVFI